MKSDPLDAVNRVTVKMPPSRAPGSGKDAWVRSAHEIAEANADLWVMIEAQSETIREHKAEIELLRAQIATRKPKGRRPRLADRKIAEIERDIAAGYSRRQVAVRCGVSAMTVQRVAQRIGDRTAANVPPP